MTRAEIEAERARVRQTIAWVREVAERAEAALPPEKRRPPGASNSEWMRQILDRAQAELDHRKPAAG
jgi:hypothetical protein